MKESDNQSQERVKRSAFDIEKEIGSVESVSILMAIGFLVGRAYFEGYYNRLSVPYLAQKVDTSTVLIATILPALVYGAALYWSFSNATKKPTNIGDAIQGNLFVFLFSFGYGFWLYQQFGALMSLLGAGSLVFLYIFVSLQKWSLANKWHESLLWKAVIILISVYGFVMAANALGYLHGTNLIKGNPGATEIKITLKDGTAFLPDSSLILVALVEQKYYLVERTGTPPVNPKIYVVNSCDAKTVELHARHRR